MVDGSAEAKEIDDKARREQKGGAEGPSARMIQLGAVDAFHGDRKHPVSILPIQPFAFRYQR